MNNAPATSINLPPGYTLSGGFYSCPYPYGTPHDSMAMYTYYLKGEGGIVEIINFVRRGDYYVKNFNAYCQQGKYYKRLGNAVNQGIRQLEQEGIQ